MIRALPSRNVVKALVVMAALAIFAASCMKQAPKMPVVITASETPEPVPVRASDKTFKDFSHKIPEHKQFECASCHRREGRSLDLDFAGHDSCVGCHLSQFTDEDQTMCAICHKDMNANPPTMLEFPKQFKEGFNMKFVHAAHDSGAGRPSQGCASCHESAGAGKTIPVGFRAHAECYVCHTPDTKIGSCSTCHELAPYRRTTPARTSFRGSFSHNDHNGVGCNDCHSVRAGGQGRQVSTVAVSQHCGANNNCATCHNGSRAFGDGNFSDLQSCARCHGGLPFDQLTGGPCR